jgi:Thioredoxin
MLPKLNNAMSFSDYFKLTEYCVDNNTTTGPDKTAERIEATKLNRARIKRIDKQTVLIPELEELLKNFSSELYWIVLSEAWCGDSAQCVPILSKIASAAPNITLELVLRDENLELMNNFLTNGTKAIPKLLCYDKQTGELIGNWGPRPAAIQEKVNAYKIQNPEATHDVFVKELHTWYAHDKGESLQKEFVSLLRTWELTSVSKKLSA